MIDKDTIEQLFRQNYGNMIRLARTLLGNDGTVADDIVQDVFTRLLQNNPDGITSGYLMAAVHHGCMNVIRQKSLREMFQNLYPTEIDIDITPIAQKMERLEEIQRLVADKMDETHRTIFRMRFDDDLTMKEISERTGLAIGTVHKYLNQSILQLKLHFKHK